MYHPTRGFVETINSIHWNERHRSKERGRNYITRPQHVASRPTLLRLVLGRVKNVKGGGRALANVAREASGIMLGILVGEDAKQILDEFSDLIPVAAVRVDLLQMGNHVHDINEAIVENDLLLLELLDQIVDLVNGAFAIDAGISFRNDGVGLLLTKEDVLCRGTVGNLSNKNRAIDMDKRFMVSKKDMNTAHPTLLL